MLEPKRTRGSVQTEGRRLQPLRRKLSEWVALGAAPANVAPAAIAAAHVRRTGRPPVRDLQHRTRLYSADELRGALVELGHRPPRPAPPPRGEALRQALGCVWVAVLAQLDLPSTRMLLSQQAELVALRCSGWGPSREVVAVVGVRPDWLAMVRSRADLIAAAFAAVLGGRLSLELVPLGGQEVQR